MQGTLFCASSYEVQSMDSSHVALVSLVLRESAFAAYKCDRAMPLGMNVFLIAHKAITLH
eukprot:4719681-Amphidinium_carterae.1